MFFWLTLCGIFALRVWLSSFGGLHPDEAYYWWWAQDLRLGYFDHPPMIAWIIAGSERLIRLLVAEDTWRQDALFYTQMSMRFVPYFLSSVVAPFFVGKSIEVVQQRTLSISQIIALLTLPVFLFGPQVITPDAPFFTGWALVLYGHLLILRKRPQARLPGDPTPFSPGLATLIGVALAFTAYSKFSAILAVFLLLITGMGLLNATVTGVVTGALMLPYVYWNYTVGLPTKSGIFFQFKNALGSAAANKYVPNYGWMAELWASQVLFWSPLLFILWFIVPFRDFRRAFAQKRLDYLSGTLFLWGLVPVAFFSLTSLQRRAEGNWPWVGIVSASVLVLSRLRRRPAWVWALTVCNFLIAFLVFVVLTQGPWLAQKVRPFSERMADQLERPSRILEFKDWDRFYELTFEATRMDEDPVLVRSYQVLSELIFFDSNNSSGPKLQSRLKIWKTGSRKSEFNFRPEFLPDPEAKTYWIISAGNTSIPKFCKKLTSIARGLENPTSYDFFKCHNKH